MKKYTLNFVTETFDSAWLNYFIKQHSVVVRYFLDIFENMFLKERLILLFLSVLSVFLVCWLCKSMSLHKAEICYNETYLRRTAKCWITRKVLLSRLHMFTNLWFGLNLDILVALPAFFWIVIKCLNVFYIK